MNNINILVDGKKLYECVKREMHEIREKQGWIREKESDMLARMAYYAQMEEKQKAGMGNG